jgi:hypothetical protein
MLGNIWETSGKHFVGASRMPPSHIDDCVPHQHKVAGPNPIDGTFSHSPNLSPSFELLPLLISHVVSVSTRTIESQIAARLPL